MCAPHHLLALKTTSVLREGSGQRGALLYGRDLGNAMPFSDEERIRGLKLEGGTWLCTFCKLHLEGWC